jgi:hypothetical protein
MPSGVAVKFQILIGVKKNGIKNTRRFRPSIKKARGNTNQGEGSRPQNCFRVSREAKSALNSDQRKKMKISLDILSKDLDTPYAKAGIIGLKVALKSACKNSNNPHKFKYEVIENRYLDVYWSKWNGGDYSAWNWLIQQTYKLGEGGIITLPGGNNPIFTHLGFLESVLELPGTRKLQEELIAEVPMNPEGGTFGLNAPKEIKNAKISYRTTGLSEFIHQKYACKLFRGGKLGGDFLFRSAWLIPNNWSLDEIYKEITPECAITAIFSPITWSFYRVTELNGRTGIALVSPIVTRLDQMPTTAVKTVDDFTAASLEDACLHYATSNNCGAHGCLYVKKEPIGSDRIVTRATLSQKNAGFYRLTRECFPNRAYQNRKKWETRGTWKIVPNHIRSLVMENVLCKRAWDTNISENQNLAKELDFNKDGLRKMRETCNYL